MKSNLVGVNPSVELRGNDLIIKAGKKAYEISRDSCHWIWSAGDDYMCFLETDPGYTRFGDNVFESSEKTLLVVYGGSAYEFLTRLLEPIRE